MTTQIHPGELVHAMDHLVLDLATPDGTIAYFTIYSLGLMRDVGSGRVALLRVATPDGVIDRCFGETIALAERMQTRLRGMQNPAVPAVGLEHPPQKAIIRRHPSLEAGEHWLVESPQHTVSAAWRAGEPAFWLSAPAPAFHPTRDYVTAMVSYRRAKLVVDGRDIEGETYNHARWEERLGRPFSSCHVALAETALEAR